MGGVSPDPKIDSIIFTVPNVGGEGRVHVASGDSKVLGWKIMEEDPGGFWRLQSLGVERLQSLGVEDYGRGEGVPRTGLRHTNRD